ncbi:unnamed protein product [Pleuronectes platessa]|uniref:Uncharacterized protein n=1 Tax=Pleuronectes platessa TaxID=8262 RepID=A0A9N7YCG3_PLEPL|nr:unnamed protein product [Pleuronectes platessa]
MGMRTKENQSPLGKVDNLSMELQRLETETKEKDLLSGLMEPANDLKKELNLRNELRDQLLRREELHQQRLISIKHSNNERKALQLEELKKLQDLKSTNVFLFTKLKKVQTCRQELKHSLVNT